MSDEETTGTDEIAELPLDDYSEAEDDQGDVGEAPDPDEAA